MRSDLKVSLLALQAAALLACSDQLPVPTHISIEPATGPSLMETEVVIKGEGLSPAVALNYNDPAATSVDFRVRALLGNSELLNAFLAAKNEIHATVPAGMKPGLYDLTVIDALGNTAVVTGAFTIRPTLCADVNIAFECGICSRIEGCMCSSGACVEEITFPLPTTGTISGEGNGPDPIGHKSVCGDRVIEGIETCDDANTQGGDGCTAMCQSEPGWSCTGEPSICMTVCGDGWVRGDEACDDGDMMPGDGCDVACTIELGNSCRGEPSVCTPNCGDGQIAGSEACDDGGLIPGDGCSRSCALEPGWICPMPGLPCITVCGDFVRAGVEVCDDGGTANGDGCTSTCTVEAGWDCGPTGLQCIPICGDNQLLGPETCDDGNALANDGCSSMCQVERGWDCGPTGHSCHSVCGDGWVRSAEVCDDGNTTSGDGCTSTCTLEQGFTCTGEGVPCAPICGDSSLRGSETCDDGNVLNNDGCSASCALEVGWVCPIAGAPCHAVCGDGLIRSIEVCDDGNATGNDGCSATCSTIEVGYRCLIPGAPCTGICGDSLVRGQETCDDGNLTPNDGCNAACGTENGWTCPTPGLACRAVCGDGLLRSTEACDDHNTANNDGCTSTCTIETGFLCPTVGQPCNAICGDSLVRGVETCDDGNIVSLDGCSSACAVETGFQCLVAGNPCLPVCGDGLVRGVEACDDHNTANGDGCSTSCTVEQGFTCVIPGQSCLAICGDGLQRGNEACDDGNVAIGDGCGATCVIELGWACYVPNSPCTALCGDHRLVNAEACDDGNAFNGDGCSSACTVESGFSCAPTGLLCNAVCGDGFVRGRETCDDGNANASDGCSSTCRIELGFECTATEPSVCSQKCGNGRRDDGESCDDGNRTNGDGCSSACAVENNYVCVRFPSICALAANVALVDDNATCPGTGTAASPYCTITGGLATALNTIYVRPGEYRENVNISNRTLTIAGDQGTFLIATSATSPALRIQTNSNVTVNGIAITGGSVRVSIEGSVATLLASQVGPGSSGAGVTSSGTAQATIDQTRVVGNAGGGVDLQGTSGFTIAASVINGNGVTTSGQNFGGVRIGATTAGSRITNTTVADNVSASSQTAGVRCDAANVNLYNTIVWGNRAGTSASSVNSNCHPTYSDLDPSAAGTGNVSVDPLFVLPTYHISGASTLINAGDPATTARLDYDGRAIPTNVRADIGAYEVTSTNYPFPAGRDAAVQALDERKPSGKYLNLYGRGLYPNVEYSMPQAHRTAGWAAGNAVIARAASGTADANGHWVFLTIGGSDMNEAVCTDSANNPPQNAALNPGCRNGSWLGDILLPQREAVDRTNLIIVNGAYPNQFADNYVQDNDAFPPIPANANLTTVFGNWDRIRDRVFPIYLATTVPTEAQVQAIFLELADVAPSVSLPDRHADAVQLEVRLGNIVRRAKQRYPNLQQIFLSSRPYSGFSTNRAPFEPYAHETGYAVKWLIQAQIEQMANGGTIVDQRAGNLNYSTGAAPWISWGPYLWNHLAPSQAVGARWTSADFENTSNYGFFSDRGDAKITLLLFHHFTLSSFSRCWLMQLGTCE